MQYEVVLYDFRSELYIDGVLTKEGERARDFEGLIPDDALVTCRIVAGA